MENTAAAMQDQSIDYENTEQRIKEHLKTVVSDEVYSKWIDNFVFEQINSDKIVIGYYGTEPLKQFKREYQETVWVHICFIVGYVKKIKIYPRKNTGIASYVRKAERNFKALKLFLLSFTCLIVAGATALVSVNYIENRQFKESFYMVSSQKVNESLRVIQLSDLHNCSYGENNSKLIDRVEKLKPDIILFTGDSLDSGEASIDDVVELCSTLTQTAPVYYIYGNNEVERYYDVSLSQEELDEKFGFADDADRDPKQLTAITDELEQALENAGVRVLKNESDTIMVHSTPVDVYGVLTSNPSAFWSYAGESFEDYLYTDTNHLKLMVLHEPYVFETYDFDNWGDLLICGHTHGGIMRVPILGPLYTHEGGLFPERSGCYVCGRYEVSGSPLIVSSGLENQSLLRLNNQPELVIIDINRF